MGQNNNHNGNLVCILERFEGHKAVLKFSDKQTLIISRKFLAKDAKEGDVLNLEFLTDKQATARRKNLARAMLEEILKN